MHSSVTGRVLVLLRCHFPRFSPSLCTKTRFVFCNMYAASIEHQPRRLQTSDVDPTAAPVWWHYLVRTCRDVWRHHCHISGFTVSCLSLLTVENPCESNPCYEGATCHADIYGYHCACPDFKGGVLCQIRKRFATAHNYLISNCWFLLKYDYFT